MKSSSDPWRFRSSARGCGRRIQPGAASGPGDRVDAARPVLRRVAHATPLRRRHQVLALAGTREEHRHAADVSECDPQQVIEDPRDPSDIRECIGRSGTRCRADARSQGVRMLVAHHHTRSQAYMYGGVCRWVWFRQASIARCGSRCADPPFDRPPSARARAATRRAQGCCGPKFIV